jgi:hypothetical protein
MIVNCFLKHGIPFQFDLDTGMLERVYLMKLKCVNQRFGLGYKPKKDDYKRISRIKKEVIIVKIEGRELEEEELTIPSLQTTFLGPTQVISSHDEGLKITDL